MQRKCLKCGHRNPDATGSELEACPSCGAIYSRVEAAAAANKAIRPAAVATTVDAPPPPPPPPKPLAAALGGAAPRSRARDVPYIDTLRATSNYPTFRQVVGLFAFFGYALAAIFVIAAIVGIVRGQVSMVGGGAFMAIFLVVITRVGKELSLMMADAADAVVRTAERLDADA